MIWALVFVFAIPFGLAVLNGAPYVPTKRKSVKKMLDELDLKPGQTLIDLGAGLGAVALPAAKRGIKVIAYEINPWLCLVLWLRTRRYRQAVKIHCRNFWKVRLPKADAVFVFGVSRIMDRLSRKLQKELPGAKAASFGFELPGLKFERAVSGINLYKVVKP